MVEQCPLVIISVLNWNGGEKTIRCLDSLKMLTYERFKIVVVDNASTDGSVERLRQAHPDIEVIRSSENLGYAAGNELAVKRALAADADLLWIVNNDATVHPDSLTQLVSAYLRHGTALYGGLPLNTSALSPDSQVLFARKFLAPVYKESLVPSRHLTYAEMFPDTQARQVGALSGSCLLIPLSLVRQYGFMDTSFFMYSEEIDYCLRLRQKGVACYLVPQAVVFHIKAGSSKGSVRLTGIVSYYRLRNHLIRIRPFWYFALRDQAAPAEL